MTIDKGTGETGGNPRQRERRVHVHLLPTLVPKGALADAVVVVADILRATTTIVHALAAGCREVWPAAEIDDALSLAAPLAPHERLVFGERGGLPPPGFDLGNSPEQFRQVPCHGRVGVCATTNGTRAILSVAEAKTILLGAFVNFSAVCEELLATEDPIHVVCAGTQGGIALEDALFAGAVVNALVDACDVDLNDEARMAWDAFEHHGKVLLSAFELSTGGRHLLALGLGADLQAAARVDRFGLVPHVERNPIRVVAKGLHVPPRRHLDQRGLGTTRSSC